MINAIISTNTDILKNIIQSNMSTSRLLNWQKPKRPMLKFQWRKFKN